MDNAARIKALRKRLGMNQEAVADGSGGRIDRTMMSKLESGRNKGSTLRVHEGLAVAMGFRSDQMSAYLGGTLGLDELLAGRTSSPPNELRATPATVPIPAPTDDDGSPLERALNAAFDRDRHELRDARAVERVLGQTYPWQNAESDLVEAAGHWLDAAASLRREGRAVTLGELFLRVTVGKGAVAAEAHAKHKAELAQAIDQHVAAFEAEAHDDVEPPDPVAVERLKSAAKKSAERR